MKWNFFLVPNYSCLQNPWLGGYRPQIPILYVLCPQLDLLNPTEQNSRVRHCCGLLYDVTILGYRPMVAVTELKKDSEVMSRGLNKVLSRHLPGRMQKSHGKPVRKASGLTFELGTSHRQV